MNEASTTVTCIKPHDLSQLDLGFGLFNSTLRNVGQKVTQCGFDIHRLIEVYQKATSWNGSRYSIKLEPKTEEIGTSPVDIKKCRFRSIDEPFEPAW